MKTKLIKIDVEPHDKHDGYKLTITHFSDGILLCDEAHPILHLQGVEEAIRNFRIKHNL